MGAAVRATAPHSPGWRRPEPADARGADFDTVERSWRSASADRGIHRIGIERAYLNGLGIVGWRAITEATAVVTRSPVRHRAPAVIRYRSLRSREELSRLLTAF